MIYVRPTKFKTHYRICLKNFVSRAKKRQPVAHRYLEQLSEILEDYKKTDLVENINLYDSTHRLHINIPEPVMRFLTTKARQKKTKVSLLIRKLIYDYIIKEDNI